MALDDVILQMGEFGKYQRRVYFLVCIPVIICGFHLIGTSFLGLTVSARCMLPGENAENVTYQMPSDMMNMIYVVKNKSGLVQACKIRPNAPIGVNNTELNRADKRCEKFVYDKSLIESSTVTEFNLICDRAWLETIGDSLFMGGVMLGAVFFGSMSDRFGRRPTFFIALFIQLLAGILTSITPSYILYTIARMIVGSSCSGVFLVTFVMAAELVGPSKRGLTGVCYQFFWNAGYIAVCGFAYIFRSWRELQLAISLPSFIFIIYWWLIPESVRWMITNGKGEEAKDLLQKASKVNGREISRATLDHLLKEDLKKTEFGASEQASIIDLFRYPVLRKKTILLSFNWFVIAGTYYGLSWNAVTLGGNIYINHLTSGLVEIPATILLAWSLNRWGRKIILSSSLLVSGIALISTVYFTAEYLVANITLFMIGKAAISISYTIIYVITVEQIPTVVRNVGLGTCCTSGKIGGVIAPFIINLSNIWVPLPLLTFGIMTFIAGAVTTLLPETLGKKLPETIQEGEVSTKITRESQNKVNSPVWIIKTEGSIDKSNEIFKTKL